MPAPPWASWPETDRAERCIRFIETFCRMPRGHRAGDLIVLAEFQRAFIRDAFRDGVRAVVMAIARANGKSALLAAMAVHALFDADPDGGAPQVPVIATRLHQIERSVYNVALAMIEAEPELEGRALIFSGIGTRRIECPHNHGELFPVSKDLAGLQGLDPSFAVVDEIGFMPLDSWTAMLSASGKRPRSAIAGIGTPGVDRDNALYHLRELVGSGDCPPGFVLIEICAPEGCALDDRHAWEIANPALAAGFLARDAIETDLKMLPEEDFRRFRLGQWVEGVGGWLGADGLVLWRALRDPFEMVDGAPTWVGVDVGLKQDSTAVAWAQRRPDGRIHVAVKIWMPRGDGALELSDVLGFIRELALTFDCQEIAYDPRHLEVLGRTLEDEGLPMVETPQSVERMTSIVMETYQAIRRKEVTHDDDELFERHVLAAVSRPNERGFTISKGRSRDKIDAAIAMCLAVHAVAVPEPKPKELIPFMAVTGGPGRLAL
jgi:phage terminase large subunit-like protein